MLKTITTMCLTGAAAVAIAVSLPGMQSFATVGFSPAAAFARGGSDNSGSGGSGYSGHDDGSGSGHSGHDDGGNSSSSDDNGGHGADDSAADDHGGRRGHNDVASTTTKTTDDDGTRHHDRGQARNRPETVLDVSSTQLKGLLDGSLVAVDQLGRHLEVEVELEHGVRTVKAQVHRSDAVSNPGKITTVSINSASAP